MTPRTPVTAALDSAALTAALTATGARLTAEAAGATSRTLTRLSVAVRRHGRPRARTATSGPRP